MRPVMSASVRRAAVYGVQRLRRVPVRSGVSVQRRSPAGATAARNSAAAAGGARFVSDGGALALVASGALRLDDAARLLRLRGRAMQDAVAPGVGAMSAIVMLDLPAVRALCDEAMSELPGLVVQPANDNAPGQVVVAGHAEAVARVNALADARRGRGVPLKVSAPFHCALMRPAAELLAPELGRVAVGPLAFPVVANVDGAPNDDAGRVRDLLIRQIDGPVEWMKSIERIAAEGVTLALEIGPGKVLAGLCKRITKRITILNVSTPESLEKVPAFLAGEQV